MHDGIIATDTRRLIAIANKEAAFLLGLDHDEIIGRYLGDVLDAVGIRYLLQENSNGDGNLFSKKVQIRNKNQIGFHDAWVNILHVRDRGGKLVSTVLIIEDISLDRFTGSAWEEFIALVSHELNTPIAIGREQIAQMHDGLVDKTTSKQKNMLKNVLQSTDRLSGAVSNLLDILSLGAGKRVIKREWTNLAHITRSSMMTLKSQLNLKEDLHREDFIENDIEMYLDPKMMQVLFSNVCKSLIDVGKKGDLKISLHEDKEHAICTFLTTMNGKSINNGTLLNSLDERFASDSDQMNSGQSVFDCKSDFGFEVSKGIVKMHRGKIWWDLDDKKLFQLKITLPKMTVFQVMSEYLELYKKKVGLSDNGEIAIIRIKPNGPVDMCKYVDCATQCTRRAGDRIFVGDGSLWVALMGADESIAAQVAQRIVKCVVKSSNDEIFDTNLPYAVTSYVEGMDIHESLKM
jgi:signal transduction histidine kinase